MIVSHKHRYLFVALPQTASTAISAELQSHYDGEPILRKHARYAEFLRFASADEKTYFVFSCIRHPMDKVVSSYLRLRDDPDGIYGNLATWRKMRPGHSLIYYALFYRRRHDYVKNTCADFSTYFLRFFRHPYDDWSSLSHKDFDFVIRYEDLQQDFAKLLELLGIEQRRPLPWINRTAGRDRGFLNYYDTPEAITRAKRVFGPFMEEWGYDFPVAWGAEPVPWASRAVFRLMKPIRHLYWQHLRL